MTGQGVFPDFPGGQGAGKEVTLPIRFVCDMWIRHTKKRKILSRPDFCSGFACKNIHKGCRIQDAGCRPVNRARRLKWDSICQSASMEMEL